MPGLQTKDNVCYGGHAVLGGVKKRARKRGLNAGNCLDVAQPKG